MAFDYSELIKLIRYKYETQEKFAKALHIGRVSLSKRLNNKLQFSQEEILRAAKLLNIPEKEIPQFFLKKKFRNKNYEKKKILKKSIDFLYGSQKRII